MIVIGYDVGRRTGEAVWRDRLIHCTTFDMVDTPARLLAIVRRLKARFPGEHIEIHIEEPSGVVYPRAGQGAKQMKEIGKRVGFNMGAAVMMNLMVRALLKTAELDGCNCATTPPLVNPYKHKPKQFAVAFAWDDRTSEHARDAAFLARACAGE